MARAAREVWQERVRGWSKSGKSAQVFAAEIGVNANTLRGWRWKLTREAEGCGRKPRRRGGERSAKGRGKPAPVGFLELVASPSGESAEERFEIVLGSDRVVRVPQRFDPGALRALVTALEVR